jgi:hypothetical protein
MGKTYHENTSHRESLRVCGGPQNRCCATSWCSRVPLSPPSVSRDAAESQRMKLALTRWKGWMCVVALLSGQIARVDAAPDKSAVDLISADVQQVCSQPAAAGNHWTVTGTGTGNVGVQIKSMAGATGKLNFTGDEWSGIQRVLAADQAGDNDSYRRCVQALTPLFLAKIPAALRDQSDVARQLRAFLAAKQLAVPGSSYGDAALISQYGVSPQSNGYNLSYPVLSGTYRALTSDISSPIGHFSRIFAEQNGSLVGVLIVETCAGGGTVICANNYADWKSSLESIVGNLQESKQTLGGGPGGGPFANQSGSTHTQLIAYDDPWRVYIDRMDSASGGPTAITLVVASLPPR